MIDRLLQCLYSASDSCNNQSETSVAPMTYEILCSIEVPALISALGISICNRPLTCHNSPLLSYNSPSASDVSGLIYIDRMITISNCVITYSVRQKKVSPTVFCHFLSNRSEFLHEISHIYYSFIIT